MTYVRRDARDVSTVCPFKSVPRSSSYRVELHGALPMFRCAHSVERACLMLRISYNCPLFNGVADGDGRGGVGYGATVGLAHYGACWADEPWLDYG